MARWFYSLPIILLSAVLFLCQPARSDAADLFGRAEPAAGAASATDCVPAGDGASRALLAGSAQGVARPRDGRAKSLERRAAWPVAVGPRR